MVADVIFAGSDGLGDVAHPDDERESAGSSRGWRRRGRRIAAVTLLILACVFSGLCLLLVASAAYDDAQISANQGDTVATVLSVSFNRTAVRFVTPDGTIVIPADGVLYPSGLKAGEAVRVEYDTQNTDLVRVAGRTFTLSFLPVGTSLLVCWAIAGPLFWLLRRNTGPRFSGRRPTS